MRVLFVGNVFSNNELRYNVAANQAAHKWNKSFTDALLKNNVHVETLSFKPSRVWPRAAFHVKSSRDSFTSKLRVITVDYWNVPVLRNLSIFFGFLWKQLFVLKLNSIDVIFFYNLYPWNRYFMKYLTLFKFRPKLVPIILDNDDPRIDAWTTFNAHSRGADGLAFLSYWGFENYIGNIPKVHFYGGIDFIDNERKPQRSSGKLKVLYSGKFERRYGGLEGLLQIIDMLDKDKFEVILTGKLGVESEDIFRDIECSYYGFLDEEALISLACDVDIFLNYRPLNISDNVMVFPSKLLFYLSFGKTVISTYTLGIHPELENNVYLIAEDDPALYIEALNFVHDKINQNDIIEEPSKAILSDTSWLWENKITNLINFVSGL
ncbi:glycosyltransferase family 4 protein [bacterium]|nr:glycosyltransferase family 4 protein [bacterium]